MVLQGGDVRELDFRFYLGDTKIGAPFHGLRAFFTTPQVRTAGWLGRNTVRKAGGCAELGSWLRGRGFC